MTSPILVAFGIPMVAVAVSTLLGVLLAPPDCSVERALPRSQWPSGPASTATRLLGGLPRGNRGDSPVDRSGCRR